MKKQLVKIIAIVLCFAMLPLSIVLSADVLDDYHTLPPGTVIRDDDGRYFPGGGVEVPPGWTIIENDDGSISLVGPEPTPPPPDDPFIPPVTDWTDVPPDVVVPPGVFVPPAPDVIVVGEPVLVGNPGNQAYVTSVIESILEALADEIAAAAADPDAPPVQVVLELPEGEDTLALSAEALGMLVRAGVELAIITGDVTVIISPELLAELEARGEPGIRIIVTQRPTEEDEDGVIYVSVAFVGRGGRVLADFVHNFTVVVNLAEFGVLNPNPFRVVATDMRGRNMGGRYNSLTRTFVFDINTSGSWFIGLVEDLIRLYMRVGHPYLVDFAGNAPNQFMDSVPVIVDGRTLIPVRFLAYALGFGVDWNPETRQVSLTQDGRTLTFAIGEMVRGMDVPAQIINDRTMVPLRFVSEFFGARVIWHEATRGIEIVR